MAAASNVPVETLVFMDIETTGLKRKGVNPEITEIFMRAVDRKMFLSKAKYKAENSIKLVFKPKQKIEKIASELTGLTAENLNKQESFNSKAADLFNIFLLRLSKPVCILAHNGKRFDFPLFKFHLNQVQSELMPDLLYADTLQGFKVIEKEKLDETQMAKLSLTHSPPDSSKKAKKTYKLQDIYERHFGKFDFSIHHAESDVRMMYEIALNNSKEFLTWLDKTAVKFTNISPM